MRPARQMSSVLLFGLFSCISDMAMSQNTPTQPQLEVRILTNGGPIELTTTCIDTRMIDYNKQLRLTVSPTWLSGPGDELKEFVAIADGRFEILVELPDIDDTASPFVSMQNLGPMQLCSTLRLGSIVLSREATISNVRVLSKDLVMFDLSLFFNTRGLLSPSVRRWQMQEIEICGSRVALLHYQGIARNE